MCQALLLYIVTPEKKIVLLAFFSKKEQIICLRLLQDLAQIDQVICLWLYS